MNTSNVSNPRAQILTEKPPYPKKHEKVKKKQAFKVGEQVFLNYPLHWNLSEKLREYKPFLFKVVKDFLDSLVEVYNVEQGHLRLDPQYLRHERGHIGFSMRNMDSG